MDRAPPSLDGLHAVAALEPAVRAAEQAVELPCELVRVDLRVDVACLLRLSHGALQAVGPVVLLLERRVADRSRPPAVELYGNRLEEAATRKHPPLDVRKPCVAQGENAPGAARHGQRGTDDLLGEDLCRRRDRRQVQLLLGAEMGEEPALADPQVAGEALQ